jgi:ferrous iron transport protein B
MVKMNSIRVALAGQPNAGKTSLFNGLTGAHQHVANYPGVTVEKREGNYEHDGKYYNLLDLPGTYSLSSFSPEERVAQDELLNSPPVVTVVVVDSTTLERSLIFLVQIIQLGANPVLALNMADEAKRSGLRLDVEQMQELLGFPVVETVGNRATGMVALREAVARAAGSPIRESRLVLGERLDHALEAVVTSLPRADIHSPGRRWTAVKLLMADPLFTDRMEAAGEAGRDALGAAQKQREKLEADTGLDIALFVSERYFGFVDGLLKEVTRHPSRQNARAMSDRIDRVLTNRVLGIPFFMVAMFSVFWMTFTVGEIPMGWIEAGFDALGGWIGGLWPKGSESPLRSLLVDGVIGGVGGVMVFLPNIVLLFGGLALLEDTGYMARAAFLVDSVMHRFGLHGKSFLPMMTGFGCTIPGIMGTRILENERDRLTTMLVLPLMSCGARLPIWMLLIPAFFPAPWRAPALWLIYALGIVVALGLAKLLRRSILAGEEAPFVMELPPYRLPTLRGTITKMGERSWIYVKKAGTIILAVSMVMWFATAYPKPSTYQLDKDIKAGKVVVVKAPKSKTKGKATHAKDSKKAERAALAAARARAPKGTRVISASQAKNLRKAQELRHSAAGHIGRGLEPLIRPLGFDWKIGTALVGAFAAKEVFVSQMGIVYSLGEVDETSKGLRFTLARDYSPLVGISLMIFLLIATPCMATVAITRRESGSWKWAMLQFVGLTVIAYVLALLVFQIGSLFM